MKCLWRLRPHILLASVFLGCGTAATEAEDVIESLEVSAVDAPVWMGDSVRLVATARTTAGEVSTRPVTWSSSDTLVAAIGAQGFLRGLRIGNAWARATIDGHADSTAVSVLAPKVEGTMYVLAAVGSSPVPVLLTDMTSPDGYRHRRWIVTDTVRFRSDGTIRYARLDRFGDTDPGAAEIFDDVTTSGGGYFEQVEQYVATAWNYVTPPPPGTKLDTLELRHTGLIRRMATPPACLACPTGPMLELLYRRK